MQQDASTGTPRRASYSPLGSSQSASSCSPRIQNLPTNHSKTKLPMPPQPPQTRYPYLTQQTRAFRTWVQNHPEDSQARQVLVLLERIKESDWEEMMDLPLEGSTWSRKIVGLINAVRQPGGVAHVPKLLHLLTSYQIAFKDRIFARFRLTIQTARRSPDYHIESIRRSLLALNRSQVTRLFRREKEGGRSYLDLIMEHFKVIATLQRQGDDFANPDRVFSNGQVHELEEDRMTRQTYEADQVENLCLSVFGSEFHKTYNDEARKINVEEDLLYTDENEKPYEFSRGISMRREPTFSASSPWYVTSRSCRSG